MTSSELPRPFVRSSSQRMLSGVCGGIAEYFGIDVNLVRVAAVVGAFVSFGHRRADLPRGWMIMPSE
ncbi:PspC domain-containing protein [Rhodococcus hoagii]|nr:PspC domain-containing protein [Prescottella equi]